MEVIKTLFLIAFFSSIKCEPLQTSLLHAGRKPHLLPVWPDGKDVLSDRVCRKAYHSQRASPSKESLKLASHEPVKQLQEGG